MRFTEDLSIFRKISSINGRLDYYYRLPDTQFLRINRFVIIPVGRIDHYSKDSITISYGHAAHEMTFPLSEKYVSDVKEKIASLVDLNHRDDVLNDHSNVLKEDADHKNVGLKNVGLEEFLSIIDKSDELKDICRMIAKEPGITRKAMSVQLQVSLKTIDRKISFLKGKGIIQHSGAKKNGEYVISPQVTEEVKNWLQAR